MSNKSQISNLPPAARLARGGKSQKGFTLIELIVVFTVMAILSTIGVASFVSYSRSQALNQTTSDLVQTLNTAKSLSASQLKTLSKNGKSWGCQTFQTLSGYGVSIGQGYYRLYIQCVASGATVQYPSSNSTDWQTTLPGDVSFDSSTNVTNVFFPVLSGGFIADGDSIVLFSKSLSLGNNKVIKTISLTNGYISVSP
jgi:prepilin-type N-terminal cleavage/methylation domain-containing protein